MQSPIRKAAKKIGMDGAIAYSSGSGIIQGVAGVISLFFIATFLSPEEQGFYYTFGSILAIQIFFELGFTGIISQYVAHEAAHLTIHPDGTITGDVSHHSRLAYLLRFCAKWYTVVAVLFFLAVLIGGYVFFYLNDKSDGEVTWKIPWAIISVVSATNLLISPFNSILFGLGYVKEINKMRFFTQIITPLANWVLLALGAKLYATAVNYIIGLSFTLFFLIKSGLAGVLINLWHRKVTDTISYFKEIFPYQWKIALSWISGYFIFQLFNPVLFATEGAVVAGQMGMTLTVLNAIQNLSLGWQNTKIPTYSGMIALKKYDDLDSLFNKTTRQMVLVCTSLFAIMFFGIMFLRATHIGFRGQELGCRFIDYAPLLIMIAAYLINQFVNSWAIYLRCHKQEPYLITSVVGGILSCASVFTFGRLFGIYGLVIGYLTIAIILLPFNRRIFVNKKREWHKNNG